MKKKRNNEIMEAVEIACPKIHGMTAETRRKIHDELLLYPSRVDALIKTLIVMGYFEWEAQGVDGNHWRQVCMSIAAHHVAHKHQWKEKRK